MAYKWKPSAAKKKAFAEKMKDPAEQAAYEQRKTARADKRRAGSKFDYSTAGGSYVPTEQQYTYCMYEWPAVTTPEQEDARQQVIFGYNNKEKVPHDAIHLVNELRRLIK